MEDAEGHPSTRTLVWDLVQFLRYQGKAGLFSYKSDKTLSRTLVDVFFSRNRMQTEKVCMEWRMEMEPKKRTACVCFTGHGAL
jgi:hypothetical protein